MLIKIQLLERDNHRCKLNDDLDRDMVERKMHSIGQIIPTQVSHIISQSLTADVTDISARTCKRARPL